jgi:3-oxoacyl-[acyl-carrier protein] reductase
MNEDRFNDVREGDEAEIIHVITIQDVDTFSELTGDINPLHMDESYAARTSLRKRVVHGMLSASFISTIIGTRLPGPGALWYEQHLRFLLPVRIGEEIKVKAKVKHKSTAQRILTIETNVYGDGNRKVIEGEAKVKMMLPVQKTQSAMEEKKGAVIITGSGRGIGAAIAKEMARNGYPVVVNYLQNLDEASSTVRDILNEGGSAVLFQADVVDNDAVRKMVNCAMENFGTISGVVNNASARIANIDFEKLKLIDLQVHFDVQIKGAFNLCQVALPHMIEQKTGLIVNIGTISADNVPPTKMLHYTLSKAALISFSRSLAVEYGPRGIRVNCVSPGMTETDLIADVPEKSKMLTKMQTPLRRLAKPEDVAGVVAFLFSEKAKHITGENLRVCGGIVMA